jgi:hypothetical protein
MGLFSGLGRMFGVGTPKGIKNPAESAMPYLNQIPGVGRQYHDPFIQAGQQAQGQTRPIYEQMAQDPTAFLNALMEGYTPSRGYQTREKVLSQALRNSAAQGGYAGTPYAQREQGELINDLLGGDQQQYLGNLMGIQGQGLGGLEGMIGRGYQSSGNLADYIGNALGNQGGLAYQGQAQLNQGKYDQMRNRSQLWGDIIKAMGSAAGGGGGFGGGGGGQSMMSQPSGVSGGGSYQWVNPNYGRNWNNPNMGGY